MPNYPWHPHTTDSTSLISHIDQIIYQAYDVKLTTEEEAVEARHELIQWYVDLYLTPQINDALHLAIQNSLEHISDVDTQALADARIPSDATNDDTLRFSIAFLYEKELAYPEMVRQHQIQLSNNRYYVRINPRSIHRFLNLCAQRASKIVEIMEDASAAIGTLAQNADFVRQAALIDLGEVVGLRMSTAGNTVKFGTPAETGDAGQMRVFHNLAPNSSFNIDRLDEIRFPTRKENETDTLTITAKNGPSEISVRTLQGTTKTVLAKDASRTFSLAEMTSSVTSQPILLPKVETHLINQTVTVDTQQTLTYTGTFSGIRLNYTVTSSDETVATVRLGETGVLVMSGIAAGTCNIRLSATNEAGTTVSEFQCTVTAQTQE